MYSAEFYSSDLCMIYLLPASSLQPQFSNLVAHSASSHRGRVRFAASLPGSEERSLLDSLCSPILGKRTGAIPIIRYAHTGAQSPLRRVTELRRVCLLSC